MASSEILISELTLEKIKAYYQFLCVNGIQKAGAHFKNQLTSTKVPLKEMDLDTFAKLLIQSKLPQVFAESGVYHDDRDWTLQEESILGDISIHMPVSFFNDGGHYRYENHSMPIPANLAYVPGALLRSDRSDTTSDLQEILVDGIFNQQRFNKLYERRLLPQLLQINSQAQNEGKLAAVTFPGIGTGQFAGDYGDIIKSAFRNALEHVLVTHQDKLSSIDIIHYDPYNGDEAQSKKIGHIDYRVCPSSSVSTTGQLAYPEGSSLSTHTLTSFVAWDHFSWPGNDFWPGSRATDDGVKAASTDTMAIITGVTGVYNSGHGSYEPPTGFSSWQHLVESKNLKFSGAIYVISKDGQKASLRESLGKVEPQESRVVEPTPSDMPSKLPGEVKQKNVTQPESDSEKQLQMQSAHIDRILKSFDKKIKTIGLHYPEAKEKAQELLDTLTEDKKAAFTNPTPQKLETFKNKAVLNIEKASPVLQRDLGWGDYLANLAKKIVNAITTCLTQILTLGHSKHQGFFAIKPSEANQEAQEVGEKLNNSLNK